MEVEEAVDKQDQLNPTVHTRKRNRSGRLEEAAEKKIKREERKILKVERKKEDQATGNAMANWLKISKNGGDPKY